MVDINSEYYRIARRYMLRLTKEDFTDPHELAKYAATAGISLEEFRQRFHQVIEKETWNNPDFSPEYLSEKKQKSEEKKNEEKK